MLTPYVANYSPVHIVANFCAGVNGFAVLIRKYGEIKFFLTTPSTAIYHESQYGNLAKPSFQHRRFLKQQQENLLWKKHN